MNEEFKIPIYIEDDSTALDIKIAIQKCRRVHEFTVDKLNEYFLMFADMYPYRSFRKELNVFIQQGQISNYAQRYSLVRAAEKTFPYFNENKKFKNEKFVLVEPLDADQYTAIQIESREIWRKYLALNNSITTRYGIVTLDESWIATAQKQATSMGISFDLMPYLLHSVTLDLKPGNFTLLFNLHAPKTDFGKRAKKQLKLDYEKQGIS